MKKSIIAVSALMTFAAAQAQSEVLRIELTDGTVQNIDVALICEMSFAINDEPSTIAGTYTGTNTVVVGGQFSYTAEVTCVITENIDGTINFTWPTYTLAGTVMGDLTLGSYTVSNIAYDKTRGGWFRDYSEDGLVQHFSAVQNGSATMDKDYTLGKNSTILIMMEDGAIKVTNPFKLGAMPLPISASFDGKR